MLMAAKSAARCFAEQDGKQRQGPSHEAQIGSVLDLSGDIPSGGANGWCRLQAQVCCTVLGIATVHRVKQAARKALNLQASELLWDQRSNVGVSLLLDCCQWAGQCLESCTAVEHDCCLQQKPLGPQDRHSSGARPPVGASGYDFCVVSLGVSAVICSACI